MFPVREAALEGWNDLRATFSNHHLTTTLGWQDVATRYRRSRIGALWLTINMGVLIAALSWVFGTLFRIPTQEFIPYLATGLILWAFVSSSIGEGCNGFVSAGGTILQVRMPLATHIGLILYRNLIILGHNLVIIPIVFLVFLRPVPLDALLALPGFALMVLNLGWMMLVLAVVCARYRDMAQIVQNILQVLFYLTPIIWSIELLPDRFSTTWLNLNPFYHLINVVRAPLLGQETMLINWGVAAGLAAVGWAFAVPFFGKYRKRVPYWL
jgi:ABC-type polysaccharide/polyol phosphate export permease